MSQRRLNHSTPLYRLRCCHVHRSRASSAECAHRLFSWAVIVAQTQNALYGRVSALPTPLVFFSFCCTFARELSGPNSELVPRSLAGTSVTAAFSEAVLVDSFFATVQPFPPPERTLKSGRSLMTSRGFLCPLIKTGWKRRWEVRFSKI